MPCSSKSQHIRQCGQYGASIDTNGGSRPCRARRRGRACAPCKSGTIRAWQVPISGGIEPRACDWGSPGVRRREAAPCGSWWKPATAPACQNGMEHKAPEWNRNGAQRSPRSAIRHTRSKPTRRTRRIEGRRCWRHRSRARAHRSCTYFNHTFKQNIMYDEVGPTQSANIKRGRCCLRALQAEQCHSQQKAPICSHLAAAHRYRGHAFAPASASEA